MDSDQNQAEAPHQSEGESGGMIDRRLLMQGGAWTAALATLSSGAFGQAFAAAAATAAAASLDSRLPDGTEFVFWEQPLSFTKTYYVDNGSPAADDNGPGTQARPFRTIGKAAGLLQPGERVVINSGIYRECVRPARGGTGPTQMISYEAAPGAKVYIRGSEILKDGWQQQQQAARPGPPGAPGAPAAAAATPPSIWRIDLKNDLFPDNYNPFALISIMGSWGWLDPKTVDMGPYLRRRGLVFVDGKPLEPMEQAGELTSPNLPARPDFTKPPVSVGGMPARRRGGAIMQEMGGVPTGRFAVNISGNALTVRLPSGAPADHLIEATTRAQAFIPAVAGAGYIRVKGLTFQHCANPYPFPQYGMVSLAGGDHWILEDNTFEWANGVGLDIGSDGDSGGARAVGASQIVRRNIFRYCGVEGIGGMGTSNTLIEDNLVEWCGWADAERGWESAGTKFHRARNMLYRRNVIRHIRFANGAWWDVDNTNNRITQNIFADIYTVGAAIHIEMTPQQNSIDNNIIWDVRNAEPGTPGQRGCAGSGIFDNASDNLIIVQNLIGNCENSGIFAIVRPDRGGGTAVGNTVSNNIFYKCGKSGIVFLKPDNKADANVYIDMPSPLQGFYEGAPTADPEAWRNVKYLDLATWRSAHGWDMTSVASTAQVNFNPETLQLTITGGAALPRVAAINSIQGDMLGRAAGPTRPAGPLSDLATRTSWSVDPRSRA
ncbi:MAG: transcriptional initiation protein Tat [Caulobacteraceae bacterium]|nr:transcriptional initiation protein Tat [Caulobacteraceae bacterium]